MYRTAGFLVWEARRRAKLAQRAATSSTLHSDGIARTLAGWESSPKRVEEADVHLSSDPGGGILGLLEHDGEEGESKAGLEGTQGGGKRGAQVTVLETMAARYSRVDNELVSYLAWMPAHALSRETLRVGIDAWQWLLASVPTLRLNLMSEVRGCAGYVVNLR